MMITDLQIRLIFVAVFLTAIFIGTYYVVVNDVFGEIDNKTQKAIDDIDKLIEKLDKMQQDNNITDLKPKPKLETYNDDKICPFIQIPKPNQYFSSNPFWCYIT